LLEGFVGGEIKGKFLLMKEKITAAITGVGAYVPDYILDNEEISRMVDTSDEWIMSRIGIKTRHILKGEGLGTSFMGVKAVNELLEKTGTDAKEVDLVICATVTPDMLFPSTANIIAYKVGAVNAFAFDMQAACSGFLFALQTGSKYVESGLYKKVVVVGADKMSSIIDYTDRATCPIFGDGAAAVMLEPNYEGLGIQNAIHGKRLGDIGYAIQHSCEAAGYGVVREFVGHGIGKEMHEDPQVPNYGRRGTGTLLKNGMCLAIEPMITMGSRQIYLEDDRWSVSTRDGKCAAHFEHTVAVRQGKADILSSFEFIEEILGDKSI
jgi:hypothetical protein